MQKFIAWRKLSPKKQEQVVDYWAKKINASPSCIEGSFLSVGIGFKHKNNKIIKQYCLKFVVTTKRSKVSQKYKIPASVLASIKWQGEMKKTKIPTDVEGITDGHEQRRVYASGTSSNNSIFKLKGAATALIKDLSDNYFFLSCHHVFSASSKTDNLKGISTVNISIGKKKVARRSRNAVFPHTKNRAALDASIAKINSKYVKSIKKFYKELPSNLRAEKFLKKNRRLAMDTPVTIPSPRTIVKGKIIGRFENKPFTYKSATGKKTVYIKEAYAVKTYGKTLKNSRTIPGDSGSPVLYKNVLIGMHFWGSPKNRLSYFIPSHLLLKDETFRKKLKFVA